MGWGIHQGPRNLRAILFVMFTVAEFDPGVYAPDLIGALN